jgi:hypothetical protein
MLFELAGVAIIAVLLIVLFLKITFKVLKVVLILAVLGGAVYYIASALHLL